MAFLSHFRSLVLLSVLSAALTSAQGTKDPCAAIGGKKWVDPADVRACYRSFEVDPVLKANILEVANKTLSFHTSTNYQVQAPPPFELDVREDILADLARIGRQEYKSEYDLHIDISRSFKRLNDGHCVWANYCFDSLWVNYLPIPLALLSTPAGGQNVHIAPEAFTVASAEFPDGIDFWQNALPGSLQGQLKSLDGARVLSIDGNDPFVAVNANAAIAGSYQGFGTRQNGFFSSYQRSSTGWNYLLGQFAQQALPLSDSVTLVIQRVGQNHLDKITIPYRSRFGTVGKTFTDKASWRDLNCKATASTNGENVYSSTSQTTGDSTSSKLIPLMHAQQQPPVSRKAAMKQPLNVILDTSPLSDVVLPPGLQPSLNPVNGSRTVAQFYMLKDGKTGVLALGSFSDSSFDAFAISLLTGLQSLKALGATQLVVDVTNNGGGYICIAHWLHRIIVGPKPSTVPQAGLDTKTRAQPLARLIVEQIVKNNADPDRQLMYNPTGHSNAAGTTFSPTDNWLEPVVKPIVNRRKDAFSPRLGSECPQSDFPVAAPSTPLFDGKKVVIVSNGRCASSCSLFSITMSKKEGAKTVVIGGKKDVRQQYCGIVGGQSSDFSTMDTEVKSVGLKNNTLAPPDLLANGVLGITWRLGFGIDNANEPEEWQNHPATLNLPLTGGLVNNPVAIWEESVRRLL